MSDIELQRLNKTLIDDILPAIPTNADDEQKQQALKREWPNFRFIFCSDDDMAEREPFQVHEPFELHLMAASLGCATFTQQAEQAIGLVIAYKEHL